MVRGNGEILRSGKKRDGLFSCWWSVWCTPDSRIYMPPAHQLIRCQKPWHCWSIVPDMSPTLRGHTKTIRRLVAGYLRYFQIRGDERRIVCHMSPNCSWNALSIRRHVEWSQTVRILVMSANQSWNFSTIWFGYKFVDKIRQCNTTFKAGRTRINIKWT